MRYFALLYTPMESRELLTALFVVDAEIRASAIQASHDVAHTRLQWWRAEIDRLINRNAQHPATQVLQAATLLPFDKLHELMVAADMDLSLMTYNTVRELHVYLDRSGGVLGELAAQCLLSAELDAATQESARSLFVAIRRIETLRDLNMAARTGRIYWPLEELERAQLSVDALRAQTMPDELRKLIRSECDKLLSTIPQALKPLPMQIRAALRPLAVLGELHAQLIHVMARANHDITKRHEIGAFRKIWTAWRAARSA